MFEKIPVVLSAEDLLDRSFKKAKKIQITDRNAFYRKKKTIIAKTESFSLYIYFYISHIMLAIFVIQW